MTSSAIRDYATIWEAAGRRAGGAADEAHAIALLGEDPVATCAAGLGVARIQGTRRRVVLVDMIGSTTDVPALAADDDVPGITDLLEYGVSLRSVACAVRGSTNLFFIPPGVETPLQPFYLEHARWDWLIDQFRDSGALLLVLTPTLIPGLERLLERLDGLMVTRGAAVPSVRVPTLGDVRLSAPYPPPARRTPEFARTVVTVRPRRRRTLWYALGAAVSVSVAGAAWFVQPYLAGRSTGATQGAAATPPPVPEPTTPVARAVAWSVELSTLNSADGAMRLVAQGVDSFPATTYSPVETTPGGAWWFRLVVGAFADSASADSFLVALRSRGISPSAAGRAVRTPFTLLVADNLSDAGARARAAELRMLALPAYVMRLPSGVSRVYVGAFERDQDAVALTSKLAFLQLPSSLIARAGS